LACWDLIWVAKKMKIQTATQKLRLALKKMQYKLVGVSLQNPIFIQLEKDFKSTRSTKKLIP